MDELALDRYEGYPSFYYKKELQIAVKHIKTGKTTIENAFVYIMHEDRELGLPTLYYVETCSEGYETFGFDTKLLEDAIRKSEGGYSRED